MTTALLTFDIDWAPDEVINFLVDILIEKKIPSVWFVTHETPVLAKMRKWKELFELGIHPNFFKNSTHGNSEDEILSKLMEIVPEARSMRTHGLYQSSNLILKASKDFNIHYDFSLFLPFCDIQTHEFYFDSMSIVRLPYNWEDDISLFYKKGLKESTTDILELNKLILDFHPIHCALNTTTLEDYQLLKQTKNNLKININKIKKLNSNKFGIMDCFSRFITWQNEKIDFVNLDKFLGN